MRNKMFFSQPKMMMFLVMNIFNALQDNHEDERIHANQVSLYCKMIGIHSNYNDLDIKTLQLVGRLHDIGKITIPDDILYKPDKLTEKEWVIMKSHATSGYHILKSEKRYEHLANYVLCHHEAMDGSGYPNGLIGEKIPLFSRIISVADAYSAMTSNRPYRKAMNQKSAIKELYRCSDIQFDRKIVDIFVKEVLISE
jgi:HD-GYP domain-containing protein (c-di-GMP phosphodiesterase class II)